MRILVTAGNTQAPIDQVRCITNIFSGRTGANIAVRAAERHHDVLLLTSHPDVVSSIHERLAIKAFRTFDELQASMEREIVHERYDAIVHCAAVSDYLVAGVFGTDRSQAAKPTTGKLKSDEPELWLRLVRAPKLVDLIRQDWHFRGWLIKFKLEVGISDERLLDLAENSRLHSCADLMVANTLEGASEWAFFGPLAGQYKRVPRSELPDRLLEAIEALPGSR